MNLLRLAQRFLRGNSGSIAVAKNVGIRVALLGLNFCTGVLVARSLGPTGRGEQAAIALWPSFIATLATFGIPTALNFHSRRNPERAANLYMSSAILMLLIGLVCSAIGATMMPFFLHGYSAQTIHAAQLFMLFAPETLVASVARAHLESRDQFTRSTLGFFYPAVATLVLLGSLKLTGHLVPITAALTYILPPAVQAVWVVRRLWRPEIFRWATWIGDIRTVLPYGLQCYGIDIIGALSLQMDLIIIVAFLTPAELGLYTVALSLSRVMNVVHASLVTILFSRAASLTEDEAISLVARAARLATIVSIFLGIGLFIVAHVAVPAVYGHEFIAVLPLLGILIGETILGAIVIVHFQSFMSTGRPGFVTIIEASWTATALALLFVLVPRMNLSGAATALFCAALVRAGCVLAAYPIVLHRPIPSFIPNASDIAYVRSKLARIRVDRRTVPNVPNVPAEQGAA